MLCVRKLNFLPRPNMPRNKTATSALLCAQKAFIKGGTDTFSHVRRSTNPRQTASWCKISKCFHWHWVFLKCLVIKAVFKWSRKGHAVTGGCLPHIPVHQLYNKHWASAQRASHLRSDTAEKTEEVMMTIVLFYRSSCGRFSRKTPARLSSYKHTHGRFTLVNGLLHPISMYNVIKLDVW